MNLDKENIVQAIVMMDNFNTNFNPVKKPMGLLTAAGVTLIDLVLESLSRGGVGDAILFCCQDGTKIKEYIKQSVERNTPWSLTMEVQVLMSDSCRTMGDVMREIDAAGLVRGYFILTGVNSISNIPFATFLEQHKQTCKKDKGAAMTLVYKKLTWGHRMLNNDKTVFLAADGNSQKILLHQKFKQKSHEKTVSLPLETVLSYSEVTLHHNLADSNIALCSPSVLPLFADNFDFQTRDDFVHGILINEELLASSLYYVLLKGEEYAACISNWKSYRTICQDILHHWAHPLSIETGSFFQDNFLFMGNHNYRNKKSTLSRSCKIVEDLLLGENSQINDNTTVSKSFIGKNCVIGNNVVITGSHLMNNVVVKDNCRIVNSFIDDNCVIEEDSVLENGTLVGANVCIKKGSKLKASIIESSEDNVENEKVVAKSTSESGTEWENSSSGSSRDEFVGFDEQWSDSSRGSSRSSGSLSPPASPAPDDTNIFLQEVIDSLARGYEDKLKCDYLILEINSSRYAYNIQLNEVNFFVVRALLSMPDLAGAKNVLNTIKDIFKFFRPVLANYIKSKTSIMDCLRAVEDSCIKNQWLEGRAGQIVHLLYDFDVVDEDSLTEWYENLKNDESLIVQQSSLVKFFQWLQQASEESDESN